jgi:hypothetical protein
MKCFVCLGWTDVIALPDTVMTTTKFYQFNMV